MIKLSSQWRIAQDGQLLSVTAGADVKYLIDLNDDHKLWLVEQGYNEFGLNDVPDNEKYVVDELLTANIIVPVIKDGDGDLKVAVIGDIDELPCIDKTVKVDDADLVVVVRANKSIIEFTDWFEAQNIAKPNLFVDIAYHHHICIGPLNFPGETACLSCLLKQIYSRWGDVIPSPEPNVVVANLPLVGALVQAEIAKITSGDTGLVNRLVDWDVDQRTVNVDQVLKMTECRQCGRIATEESGKMSLPWERDGRK